MPGRWGTPEERLWRHVEKSDGCWVWTGSLANWGYGQIKVDGRPERTHRLSWTIHFGPIPDGLDVLHTCDNPPCVRPDHLFLGTDGDNAQDMASKGRQRYAWPLASHRAKLTVEQVMEIRDRYRAGGISTRQLAREYNVHYTSIIRLLNKSHFPKIEG